MTSTPSAGTRGAFWDAWAISLRLPPDGDHEAAALSALTGDVGIVAFALYTVALTAAVGGCHLALGTIVQPADLAPGRGWSRLVLVAGAVWFAILIVPTAPWAPLELAVLLGVCRIGLARLQTPPAPALLEVVTRRIQPSRLLLLAALPAAATVTHALIVALSPSDGC